MSESIASSSSQAPENELDYAGLLASVRERFRIATASPDDKVRLFATQTPDLFELFLDALPPSMRQHYTCHTCKKFLQRYGGVVLVGPDGKTAPVMWDPASTPEPSRRRFAPSPRSSPRRRSRACSSRARRRGESL